MKIKHIFILPALIVVALVGCNKPERDVTQEEVQPRQEWTEGTFAFSSQFGAATKVGLNADNSLFWTAGDKIAVYDYKKSTTTKVQQDGSAISGGEGTTAAKFTPETHSASSDWYDGGDAASQAYSFFAWYPLNGSIPTPDESPVVTVGNVNATQTQAAGIGSYIICWAESETTKTVLESGTAPTFSFAPKTALLKLTIKNSADLPTKITSLRISAASGNIAGNASLNLATGVLSGGASNSITYTPSDPIEIAAGATASVPVLISVLPGTPGTLSVSMSHAGYIYTVSDITLATIESGHVYAKTATITGIERGIAITNSNSENLLNSAAMVDNTTPEYYYYGTANCIVFPSTATSANINIAPYKASVSGTEANNKFLRKAAAAGKNSDARKAKVIWAEGELYFDEAFKIVSGNTTQLVLSKSAGTKGNALIGIYDGSDKLLWSYHVWCPADSRVVPTEDSNFTAYNLALGQIESEYDTYMYYQWGRKDPLGRARPDFSGNQLLDVYGASLDCVGRTSTGETVNNLDYSRQHPNTFITEKDNSGESTAHDWFSMTDTRAAQNDYLWKYDGAPTIYDPCPVGYHIPSKDDYLWGNTSGKTPSFTITRNGLVYVLGGYRGRANANVNYVASSGYYWSSQAVGGEPIRAYYLYFNAETSLNPANNDGRAYGFGVRCVKN